MQSPNMFGNYGNILHEIVKKKKKKNPFPPCPFFFLTCYPKYTYFFLFGLTKPQHHNIRKTVLQRKLLDKVLFQPKSINIFLFLHQNIILTLLLLNTTCPVLANSADTDQLASKEANWSRSVLFVIKYVNFYRKPRSSNLIGWKLEVGKAS